MRPLSCAHRFVVIWSATLTVWGLGWMSPVAPVSAQESPRPKYGPDAVRLYDRRTFVQQHPAPDYWSLSPHYTHQSTGAACGLATAAMAMNALRASSPLPADEPLITQQRLLEDLTDPRWKKQTAADGAGLTLEELADLLRQASKRYLPGDTVVEVVIVPRADDEALRLLRGTLAANERGERDLVIVNFLQSRLTGDPEGAVGHFAPLAAYDQERSSVLVLDPDRQWYEPYWSPDTALLAAMATRDATSGKMRGYLWLRR